MEGLPALQPRASAEAVGAGEGRPSWHQVPGEAAEAAVERLPLRAELAQEEVAQTGNSRAAKGSACHQLQTTAVGEP